MTYSKSASADYCADLVRARDEDRWLAARYAPARLRARLMALYAFRCALRRIPDIVSEPALGEMRLQFFRDALSAVGEGAPLRREPVLEALAAAGLAAPEWRDDLGRLVDHAARPLYDAGFASPDDLAAWLEASDGAVDAIAARLAGGDEALAARARIVGGALALAREAPRQAPDVASAARARAQEIWLRMKPAHRAAPAVCTPALIHHFLLPAYLKHAKPFPVLKRALLFRAAAFGQ